MLAIIVRVARAILGAQIRLPLGAGENCIGPVLVSNTVDNLLHRADGGALVELQLVVEHDTTLPAITRVYVDLK